MSLLTDLISHWKLNEASGTRVDSHGSNDLTDNNTVTSAAGKIGDAASFDAGNSENLSIAGAGDQLGGGDRTLTIALWVWADALTSFGMVLTQASGASGAYEIRRNSTNAEFDFLVNLAVLTTTGSSYPTGQWVFVVAWHDATADTINIQVNNGGVFSQAHVGGLGVNVNSFRIGGRDDAFGYHDGLIDSVSMWSRVLTADEKTELYNAGDGFDYPFAGTQTVTLSPITAAWSVVAPSVVSAATIRPNPVTAAWGVVVPAIASMLPSHVDGVWVPRKRETIWSPKGR